jgi:hypothetical protein
MPTNKDVLINGERWYIRGDGRYDLKQLDIIDDWDHLQEWIDEARTMFPNERPLIICPEEYFGVLRVDGWRPMTDEEKEILKDLRKQQREHKKAAKAAALDVEYQEYLRLKTKYGD